MLISLTGGNTNSLIGLRGLYNLANAANGFVPNRVPITTAGTNTNVTAAQVLAGAIILAAGASGGFTITLPGTVALIAAFGPVPLDGTFSKVLIVKNDAVGQIGTLTAGDGSTTINGTATIASNTTRTFLLTLAAGGLTITIDNLGSMAL